MDNDLYILNPVPYNLVMGIGTLNSMGLSDLNLMELFICLKLSVWASFCGIVALTFSICNLFK